MKRVYISVINDLVTDQRIHRVAEMLLDHGLEVTCVGRRLRHSPGLEGAGFNHRRFRMLFRRGPLFYACFNIRLFIYLFLAPRPALIISNDLDTLPASRLASRVRKVKLIYDSHELFTQVPELIERRLIQGIWKWIESRNVPKLDHAVTVSYSIAQIYRRLYRTKFSVVRNVPKKRDPSPDPRVKKDYEGRMIIIYQGALNVGRGLELMIETMQFLEKTVLLLVGTGDIEERLKAIVKQKKLGEKIEFRGRVVPDQLFPLTCSADLGISLEEDRGLNYRYALPNKLFDYIQARIPVLCSDLPEISRIVRTYGVGVVTGEREPEKLAGIIRYIFREKKEGAWRDGLERAANDLCWEKESGQYLSILKDCGIV